MLKQVDRRPGTLVFSDTLLRAKARIDYDVRRGDQYFWKDY
jgi:hypothetical protein